MLVQLDALGASCPLLLMCGRLRACVTSSIVENRSNCASSADAYELLAIVRFSTLKVRRNGRNIESVLEHCQGSAGDYCLDRCANG